MFFFSLVNYDDWHFQDNSDPARHKKDLPILTIVASPRWSFTEIANLNMASEVELTPAFQDLTEKIRRILPRLNPLVFIKIKISWNFFAYRLRIITSQRKTMIWSKMKKVRIVFWKYQCRKVLSSLTLKN